MNRQEEQDIAVRCQEEGIEFRRRPGSYGFIAAGPAAVMEAGKTVVYTRESDLALKRYILTRMIWEGQGRDGSARRVFELEYQRKSAPHPMGTCKRCKEKNRTDKMRCSGNGLYCSPKLKTPTPPYNGPAHNSDGISW